MPSGYAGFFDPELHNLLTPLSEVHLPQGYATSPTPASSSGIDLQGQKLNPIGEILGRAHFGDEFEVVDAATDGHKELVGVHYACEWNTTALPPRSLGQQVLVLAEENTPERMWHDQADRDHRVRLNHLPGRS